MPANQTPHSFELAKLVAEAEAGRVFSDSFLEKLSAEDRNQIQATMARYANAHSEPSVEMRIPEEQFKQLKRQIKILSRDQQQALIDYIEYRLEKTANRD